MNNKWKWVLSLTLALIVLIGPPLAWRFFLPYGMMSNTNKWSMPMMYGAPGMMAFGMMFLMWLISLALLVLIGLGIFWLVRELSAQKYS